jgi:hypothetical protein
LPRRSFGRRLGTFRASIHSFGLGLRFLGDDELLLRCAD